MLLLTPWLQKRFSGSAWSSCCSLAGRTEDSALHRSSLALLTLRAKFLPPLCQGAISMQSPAWELICRAGWAQRLVCALPGSAQITAPLPATVKTLGHLLLAPPALFPEFFTSVPHRYLSEAACSSSKLLMPSGLEAWEFLSILGSLHRIDTCHLYPTTNFRSAQHYETGSTFRISVPSKTIRIPL